jgi:hypothetical protein
MRRRKRIGWALAGVIGVGAPVGASDTRKPTYAGSGTFRVSRTA